MWPQAQRRFQALFKRGLQTDSEYEKNWAAGLGTLLENA
jgi:hypothetical protein